MKAEKHAAAAAAACENRYPNRSCIISGIVSIHASVLTKTPAEATDSSAPYW